MTTASGFIARFSAAFWLLTGSAVLAQCDFVINELPEANGYNASGDHAYYLVSEPGRLVRYEVATGDTLVLAPPEVPQPYASTPERSDIDEDGDRICYLGFGPENTGDYLYVYDVGTGTITSLFDNPRFMLSVSISGDGNRIFYYSDSPDGSLEIYRVDIATREVIQLTHVPKWSGNILTELYPVGTCPDGSCAAFDSRYREDLLEDTHIAYWHEDTGYHQITPNMGDGWGAEITAAGEVIVFVSPLDLVPGQNPDNFEEVFLYHVPTGVYQQVTKSNRQPMLVEKADISADGRMITVLSDGDYNNEFPSRRSAAYLIDTLLGTICTVSDTDSHIDHYPSISSRGDAVYFRLGSPHYDARGGPAGVPVTTGLGLAVLILGLALYGWRTLRSQSA